MKVGCNLLKVLKLQNAQVGNSEGTGWKIEGGGREEILITSSVRITDTK